MCTVCPNITDDSDTDGKAASICADSNALAEDGCAIDVMWTDKAAFMTKVT